MERADANQDRFKSVYAALEQADKLRREGKHADAERIWTGLEQLYGNDPAAKKLLEAEKARQHTNPKR
jgi:hypothetical protein